jgi:G3E family GTPase
MKLHIVGGFLGSGKTTAITNGAKLLIQQGKRVAVVTNDQGKYLVDTSFMDANEIPAAEVTNGCFCCNFDQLTNQLELLERTIYPDCIFAESVGSCTDLVATVIKPLQLLKRELFTNLTFSVFVDSRLILDLLRGQKLPFSDPITYIFKKQIEESDLLIINKIDLLQTHELLQLHKLTEDQFDGKMVIFQDSLNQNNIQKWVDTLDSRSTQRMESLAIDYEIYGKGEAELAWLDEEVNIQTADNSAWEHAITFIDLMIKEIRIRELSIGHLKFLLKGEGFNHKISFTTILQEEWKKVLPVLNSNHVQIMVNSRIETTPEIARMMVQNNLLAVSSPAVLVTESRQHSFQPGFPNPTHRITRQQPCCDECKCTKNLNYCQIETCLCDCKGDEEECCSF